MIEWEKIPLRFRHPRTHGTLFCYRRLDVLRVVELAKAISPNPSIIDVGCSNGDFTSKLLEYTPNAVGIDIDPKFNTRPFIRCMDVNDVKTKFALAFLGWMEIKLDYRKGTAKLAPIIVSVWERGGCCGTDDCTDQPFDEFGFENIASWRTPAYFDIRHRALSNVLPAELRYRGLTMYDVGSVWDVWTKPEVKDKVQQAFRNYVVNERAQTIEPYDFERHLDESGFTLWKTINGMHPDYSFRLWEVVFH